LKDFHQPFFFKEIVCIEFDKKRVVARPLYHCEGILLLLLLFAFKQSLKLEDALNALKLALNVWPLYQHFWNMAKLHKKSHVDSLHLLSKVHVLTQLIDFTTLISFFS